MAPLFTPGPWHFLPERAPTNRGFCRIIGTKSRPNRGNLAHVMGLYSDTKGREADANANLIASAPELYEALAWVRTNYAAGSTAEINARIDAALAKARGEQS